MNLREHVIRGLSWTLNGQLLIQGINFLTWIILARLLSPDDFGLIAMLVVLTRLLALFRNLGLTEALIQKKALTKEASSSVFWLHLILGGLIAALFYLSGAGFARFFEEELILKIIGYIALDFFLGAFYLVPSALLNKALAFKSLFIIEFIGVLIGAIIGISMAWMGYGYWSLVFRTLSLTLVSGVLVGFFVKWSPVFSISFSALQPLLRFSLPLLAAQTLRYFNRNLDDLLIGKELGTQSLGIYNRAYALMLLPLSHITNGAAKVLFPAFAILQDDPARIKKAYLKAARLIALLTFPLMVGLFVLADQVILNILGSHWKEMIPIVKILALLGMFQSVSALNGSVFQALDATRLQLKIRTFSSLTLAAFLGFGIYYLGDLEGLAICYAIAACLIVFPIWYILGGLIGASLLDLLKNLMPILLAAIGMGIFLIVLDPIVFGLQNLFDLFFRVILGMGVYYLLLVLFKVRALQEFKALLGERFRKMR